MMESQRICYRINLKKKKQKKTKQNNKTTRVFFFFGWSLVRSFSIRIVNYRSAVWPVGKKKKWKSRKNLRRKCIFQFKRETKPPKVRKDFCIFFFVRKFILYLTTNRKTSSGTTTPKHLKIKWKIFFFFFFFFFKWTRREKGNEKGQVKHPFLCRLLRVFDGAGHVVHHSQKTAKWPNKEFGDLKGSIIAPAILLAVSFFLNGRTRKEKSIRENFCFSST